MNRADEIPGFQPLETAGILHVYWDGPPLDLYSMATVQLNLHDIIERVGFWIVSEAGFLYPSTGRFKPWRGWRAFPSWQPAPRFIRAVPFNINVDSLSQQICFLIANILADADMRAILQNLAANIVWAIGASGVKGIRTDENLPPPALQGGRV